MPAEPTIISVTTDDFASIIVDLLGRPPSEHKVVLLAHDPGAVVTHILQREGYQVHVGSSQEVVAEVLAAQPDLIVISPQILAQLLRGGR
jgi:hypothetical protein